MSTRGPEGARREPGRLLLVVLCLLGAAGVATFWATRWKARPPAISAAPKTVDAPAPIRPPVARPAGFGGVAGSVRFHGAAPELAPINRRADAYCGKIPSAPDESIVVNPNHTLRNVLVRIEGAPPAPPPTENVIVAQQDCAYRPRIVGIVAGQHVLIQNGDQTLHNVHAFRGTRSWFNQAQLAGSDPIPKTAEAGALIKLKCDVHPWMTGYIRVQENGLFAVTDESGGFLIEKIPAGRYSLVVWQEKLGERSAEVVIEADRVAEVDLDFN